MAKRTRKKCQYSPSWFNQFDDMIRGASGGFLLEFRCYTQWKFGGLLSNIPIRDAGYSCYYLRRRFSAQSH
jgi:hypothetical protein